MYKKEDIVKEANDYYYRNEGDMESDECSDGIKVFCDFYNECNEHPIRRMLEVGCAAGYNLRYMNKRYGVEAYGLDPSNIAISKGNSISNNFNVKLFEGFADNIPFESDYFDFVYIGFCLYQISRDLIGKCIIEGDRVLQTGGIWRSPILKLHCHLLD